MCVAEENRRVAAREVRRGEEAADRVDTAPKHGPSRPAARRATIGPRKPTAATRKSAVISDVAAAVCGLCVRFATENSGTAQAIATPPPISRPSPIAPRLDRGVGERTRRRDPAARRPATSTANSATATALPTATRAPAARRR